MVVFLNFLKDFEFVIYFMLGIISLRYVYQIFKIQIRLQKTIFGLEQELLRRQRNGALGMLVILMGVAGLVYVSAYYFLPEARRMEQIRITGNSSIQPTVLPSPTPYILFGVDISGCVDPRATILEPKPGDTVQGNVEFRISANIEQFAFYKIELGKPEVNDVWFPLFTSNEPVTDGAPASQGKVFIWDSSTMPPGVYHLRLMVMARDGTSTRPCLVPIQVLSTET